MEKLQESIKNIRKEELIKKISDLQSNLAIEPLNSEEIINHLETEDKLSITEIETYVDRIIDQHFTRRFLTETLLIYLIKGISLIAKTRTLTLNERNLKVDKYLLDQYNEAITLDNEIDEMNEEDAPVKVVTDLIKKVYLLDKKLNPNNVVELLNSAGLTNKDIIKTLNFIDENAQIDKTTVYKSANALASVISLIYTSNFDK